MQKAQITNNHRLIEFWLKFKNIFWPSQNLWHAPSPLPLPAWEGGGWQVKNFRKAFLSGGMGSKKIILVVWWVHKTYFYILE